MAAKAEKMRQMVYDENSKRRTQWAISSQFSFSLKETGSTTKHETTYRVEDIV